MTSALIRITQSVALLGETVSMFAHLKLTLLHLHQSGAPFHPVILVFASGPVSDVDCIPMPRDPKPGVGQRFDANFAKDLAAAFNLNPSIHDGA